MSKASYQTNARMVLLEFFNANPDRQFTAEELCHLFSDGAQAYGERGVRIAKSTLYRQLSTLCREGFLQRFDGTDPATGNPVRYYQPMGEERDCAHHFHLKCLCCGGLQHLECERTETLLSHIMEDHQFTVDCGRSILFGLCEACAACAEQRKKTVPRGYVPHRCSCGGEEKIAANVQKR